MHAPQLAAHVADLAGRFELPHRLLDPHAEELIVQLLRLGLQRVAVQLAELPRLHDSFSCAKRAANRVLIGSLAAASSIARLASVSFTPSISNRMRPGL